MGCGIHRMATAVVALLALLSACKDDPSVSANSDETFAGIEEKHERGPLQVVVRVSPKEPTIADRIELALEVTIDENYSVEMPSFGDKLEQFGIRDFRESQPRLVDGNRTRTVRTYELEPFLSGEYQIPPMQFTFTKKEEDNAAAEDHQLETEPIKLTVSSLLDEKKDALVIHEIAPPVSLERPSAAPFWSKMGAAIAAVIALCAVACWLLRRRKKKIDLPPPVPAHEIAFQQLEQLVADDLPRKGEMKIFYQRISDILRRYIENRFGLHAPEQTTEEFLQELRDSPKLPPVHQAPLKGFLQHCDLVKFADHEPTTEDVQRTFDACKHFIIETQSEASTVPQPAVIDA
ncbi:MAG: hypothetical protein ACI9R3_004017 [Verrucomicrobiales bacterium]